MMRLLGAVLAGGGSRRFGSDKALALLDGEPLIAHVVRALAAQTDAVVTCGKPFGDLVMVADRPGPGLGPLGGIAAALHHAARHGYDAVISAGCDMPVLPSDLAARLCAARSDGGAAAAYLRDYPVIGLWPVAAAGLIDAHIAASDRSMRGWARLIGARPVDAPPIPNINCPQDLDALAGGGAQAGL